MTPAAVFVCALLARLWGIGDKPFWLDELTTLRRASLPWRALVHDSLMYHHLPGYFALVSAVLPFGRDEVFARMPSALLGAAACALTAAAASRIGGRAAGLLAGLLLAFSPLQVQYGQEARSYALLTCCLALALLGLLRLLETPERAARWPWRHDADPASWAMLLGGTFGAVNTLSIGLAWPVAATLGWVVATWRLAFRARLWRLWLAGHALVAALTVPWFVAMYRLNNGWMSDGLTWIPPLDRSHFSSALATVYLMRTGSVIRASSIRVESRE